MEKIFVFVQMDLIFDLSVVEGNEEEEILGEIFILELGVENVFDLYEGEQLLNVNGVDNYKEDEKVLDWRDVIEEFFFIVIEKRFVLFYMEWVLYEEGSMEVQELIEEVFVIVVELEF